MARGFMICVLAVIRKSFDIHAFIWVRQFAKVLQYLRMCTNFLSGKLCQPMRTVRTTFYPSLIGRPRGLLQLAITMICCACVSVHNFTMHSRLGRADTFRIVWFACMIALPMHMHAFINYSVLRRRRWQRLRRQRRRRLHDIYTSTDCEHGASMINTHQSTLSSRVQSTPSVESIQ